MTWHVHYRYYDQCDQDFDKFGFVVVEGLDEEDVIVQFRKDHSSDYGITEVELIVST